ncbi:probable disease resistance protein At4g27220 [Vitis riparia]|uniref:probable disease resistance protein At4g27220 n=1 Tax=Vitis riparia TaxID=96939 RepID=UPI00155A83F4|nr:probable disease resistance protein At4g27220 [Vitis riparia]
MAEILISVAAKVAECLVAPIVRPLGYLFNYRSNLDKLEEQVENLGDARGRLQRDVDDANRQGDEIEPDVQRWLTRTEGIIQTARTLIEDENAANTSCFNLKLRYQRSRQAKKQSGDICKMQEENNFPRVAYRPPPQGIWSPRLRDCEAFKSRESLLIEIMEALGNDDIRMIGVWGMGGVGKTTLANQVAKKAEEDKLFEKEEELGRADRICKSLNKHKTVLVILDDIWEELSLAKIGIPYGDVHKGCKVLLSSREHAVLSREMGTQKNFHVQHLCEKEAWSLFENTAGDSVEKFELRPIALEVVKKCEGLPVAIVTIAKALKGESVAVWKNALEELKRSAPTNIRGVSKNVYSCLELSYNHLEGDEVKRLFLLCGMLGYGDISMDQLLKYGMGLDLFEHVSSLEQITNKLVTLVKILKDSSLLLDVEDGYGYEGEWPGVLFGYNDENKPVRMHDVVGDVARAIAAKDPHRFVVIKEALVLEEWQRKEEFRNCSRISLQCGDLRELPERLVCSKLEFFLLNNNDPSLRIPNTFFQVTELLKVLDLSALDLTPLPSSLGFLSNLRTLRVYGCPFQDIAVIGELKKLQVLSFERCEIERLPKEFMQLTDLRALDLWDCSHLEEIPRNVISSLSRLEHLCLAESFTKWGAEGSGSGESNNACLSELNNLSYLKTLCIEIRDPNLLSKDLVFEKLTRYVISVSSMARFVDYKRSARTLKLWRVDRHCLVDCFSKLFKTVEDLELYELEDKETKHVLYELDTDGFLQLKFLRINDWPGIQYIVDSTKGVPPHSALPILEELEIDGLENMDAVCYGPVPERSFGKLRSLAVHRCKRLKSFISLPMEQGRDGWVLRKMGSSDSTRDFSSTGSSATQELSRTDVPTPFFNEQDAFLHLEQLILKGSKMKIWQGQFSGESFCKLRLLKIRKCHDILVVIPSNVLPKLHNLEELHVSKCNSVKEVFELVDKEYQVETLP